MNEKLVPVVREALSDLETPLSTYRKLANCPNSFLLESVEGGERWGRYSIIGLAAREQIRVQDGVLRHHRDGELLAQLDDVDPLQWIADYAASIEAPDLPDLPRLNGGLVGYFGADTVRMIEPRLAGFEHRDTVGAPDILLLRADELVVFDNLRGRLNFVILCASGQQAAAQQRIDELMAQLAIPLESEAPWQLDEPAALAFESQFGEDEYKAGVERIRDYILAGDAMQVVLSQQLSAPYSAKPLDLYRALRSLNPSPYLYYFDFGDFHVAGSSPEILVRLEDGEVTLRPIAGTRPRGATPAQDVAYEKELLADPKELAEHLMLIDLGRNDVGRIAEKGSVQLSDTMVIERYSHVMHIVSNVTGQLRGGANAMDVLKATFPAGTLSGAPKIRALEIIDELEPTKRGVYSGAVGYLAWNGSMDTAIAIRTAVIKNGQVYIQAGAGIVADSVPDSEWQETMSKAGAVLRAAGLAQARHDKQAGVKSS
ncbi:MAG: anthranilate synthase component I [Oceanococcus sp.]